MKELDFQKALTDAAKKMGGYGTKLAHAEKVGIPDLLIAVRGWTPAIIECKRKDQKNWVNGQKTSCPHPTLRQRIELEKMRSGGLAVGVAVLFDRSPQWIFASADLAVLKVHIGGDDFIKREKGEPWTNVLQRILEKIAP